VKVVMDLVEVLNRVRVRVRIAICEAMDERESERERERLSFQCVSVFISNQV
jgi:hypothetical protein